MILLIGAGGSMGRRYSAILKYLNKSFLPVDKETSLNELGKKAVKCAGAIVATPTDTHEDVIKQLIPTRIPILCEKPVTKNPEKLKEILKQVKSIVFSRSQTPSGPLYTTITITEKTG